SISDELMWRYFELLTDLTPAEVAKLRDAAAAGEQHPRDLKADLARRIVADFHSQAEAQEASNQFDQMFRDRQMPSDVPTIEKPAGAIRLVKLLAAEALAPSVAEAQRLVAQGGVRVNGERVSDIKIEVGLQPGEEALIQVGSRKFLRVVFK